MLSHDFHFLINPEINEICNENSTFSELQKKNITHLHPLHNHNIRSNPIEIPSRKELPVPRKIPPCTINSSSNSPNPMKLIEADNLAGGIIAKTLASSQKKNHPRKY